MALPDDVVDKAAILGRRAAFVASALTGIGIAAPAHAEEEPAQRPTTCPERDLSPEAEAKAKELVLAAQLSLRQDRAKQALELFLEAYGSFPSDKLAVASMRAHALAGDPEAAAVLGIQHILCGGDLQSIRETMASIEAESGRVVILVTGPDAGSGALYVDDRPVDWDRARLGVLAVPGVHQVSYRRPSGAGANREVVVKLGEVATVEIVAPPDEPPRPCLSPCLSYYEPRGSVVRLDAGVIGPFAAITTAPSPEGLAGVGLRAAIGIRIEDKLLFEGDLFGAFAGNATTRIVLAGSTVLLRYHPTRVFGAGIGVSGGYLADLTDEADARTLLGSPFVGPVLVPSNVRLGPAQLEVRLPLWFALTKEDGVESFRPALFAPHLTVTFGGAVGGDPESS